MKKNVNKLMTYLLAFIVVTSSFFQGNNLLRADEANTPEDNTVARTSSSMDYSFDAKWSSAVSPGIKDYSYQNDDKSKIFVTPSNNNNKTINWSVNFSVSKSEQVTFPEGSVKITVLSYIFENWNDAGDKTLVNADNEGKPLSHLNWQIAEAPNTNDVADFNYVDNGDGTYTLSNYKDLPSGFSLDFQQSFSFVPSYVKVDGNGNLRQTYPIKLQIDTDRDGNTDIEEIKNLEIDFHSNINKGAVDISVARHNNDPGTYLTWQQSWGERPADDDGNTYFYVVWAADYERGKGSTLPFTSTITDTGSTDINSGEVVGTGYRTWHDNSFRAYVNSSYPDLASINKARSYRQYTNGIDKRKEGIEYVSPPTRLHNISMQPRLSQFILKRYPLSLIRGKSAEELRVEGITLRNSVKVDEIADNGEGHTLTAEKEEKVFFYIGEGPFGKYNPASSLINVQGARTLLLEDNTVRIAGPWGQRSHTWTTSAGVARKKATGPWNVSFKENSPYYVSGNLENIKNLTFDELKNKNNIEKLNDDDYYYKSFDLTFSEYKASSTILGDEKGYETDDYSSVKPVEVWIRKAGSTEFIHYANVKKKNNKTYTVTDTSGKAIPKDVSVILTHQYPLPSDVVDIEYRHDSDNFYVDISSVSNIVLKPTENVKNLLRNSKNKGESSFLTSISELKIDNNISGNTATQPREFTLYSLDDVNVTSSLRKHSGDLSDLRELGKQKRRVVITNENKAFSIVGDITGGGKSDLDIYKSYAFKKGTFYDLLPKGTYVDTDTTEMKLNWAYSYGKGNVIPKENYTVSFIEDYKDSGMTMMVVSYEIPDELMNFGEGNPSVLFAYDMYNSYDNIVDRGADVINSVAFVNETPEVKFNPIKGLETSEKMTHKDVYSKLALENIGKILFTEAIVNYNPVSVAQAGFSKSSSSGYDEGYAEDVTVNGNGNYSYRLRYTQAKETKSDSIIFYDILENGSKDRLSDWKGEFLSVDTTSLEQKTDANDKSDTLKPTVYYATVVPTTEQMDISDTNIWKSEKPQDNSQIKAIAVDASKTKSGKPFVLDRGSNLSLFINMKAPDNLELNGKKAVNTASIQTRTFDGESATQNDVIKLLSDASSVTLNIPTVTFSASKTWNGISKENADKEVVKVKLFKNGEETDKIATLNKDNNFAFTFENLKKSDVVDGKEKDNIYSVKELDLDDNVIDEGREYISNGKTYKVHYEEGNITNTLVNPKKVISGSKIWDDNDNQDGIRPDEVTIHLLANGKDTGRETKATKENKWKYSFDNVSTYDNNGDEIVYSVTEDDVQGYTSRIDGFKITNSHIPEVISVPVEKNWIDNNDKKNMRPDEVHISLYADDKKVSEYNLNKDEAWKHEFNNLPKFKEGKEIEYKVVEDPIEEYLASYSGDYKNKLIITNTISAKINIPIKKLWFGMEDKSIEVQLLRDNEIIDKAVITKEDGWKYSFDQLDLYDKKDGHEYEYTIKERVKPGYISEVKGTQKDGFEIRNTYSPKTTEINIDLNKKIDGDPKKKDKFRFVMKSLDTDGHTFNKEVYIEGEGRNSFEHLVFEMPGTYKYEIREINDNIAGYVYDDSKYILLVEVEDIDGVLKAEKTIRKDGKIVDKIEFTNKYEEKKTVIAPKTDDNRNIYTIVSMMLISLLICIRTITLILKGQK